MISVYKLLLAFLFFNYLSISASSLKWYSFEEGVEKAKSENKIILIDFYTDWCGWCKKMDSETYSNTQIISEIQKGFVPVKINPEKNEFVTLDNQTISVSQLSQAAGVRGFPATAFFTPDMQLIDMISGYLDVENFNDVLRFMKSGKYEKIAYQDYRLFTELEKMKQSDPDNSDLSYLIGYFHLRFFNEPKMATEHFQSALNHNADMKELFAGLYLAHTELNNTNDAHMWKEKAEAKGFKSQEELDNKAIELVRKIFAANN